MSETASTGGASPLDGLLVLDCATFIAAPYTAGLLAEFGARVIKIEQPGTGDPFRRYGTPTERGDTLAWLTEGRNKESIELDLRSEEGAAIFKKLAAQADVVTENFRPGTLDKWGLGYRVLSALNPGLVMLSVSGYGQTGPYRDKPGFARIAHAFGGLTYLAGMPGEIPVTPGSTSLADYMTGIYGAFGVMVALEERRTSGKGQVVDIALYESVFRVLDELAPAYAKNGTIRQPEGTGTLNACPHGHFRCGDGSFVAIACTSDKMFERLAHAMGNPDLATPAQYGRVANRLAEREHVDGLVAAWTGSMPRDQLMEIATEHGVPMGPVNTVEDLFADPHIRARENLVEVEAEGVGTVTLPNVVPRLSRTPGTLRHPGKPLGADTERVLKEILGEE
ncbi:MAG: CoA transferase [Alphaproteobacteria bacterium]|nr:CoA transferase [Alphaproteobacteria bacterium]